MTRPSFLVAVPWIGVFSLAGGDLLYTSGCPLGVVLMGAVICGVAIGRVNRMIRPWRKRPGWHSASEADGTLWSGGQDINANWSCDDRNVESAARIEEL